MTQYALMPFNMPAHSWISLHVPYICLIILDIWQGFEYASGIKYAKVLNMLRYGSYAVTITLLL